MSKVKILIIYVLTIAIAITVFATFYRDVHYLGGLKVTLDKEQLKNKAKAFAKDLRIPTSNTTLVESIEANNPLLKQVQREFGFKKGNQILRNYLPGFSWRIKWQKNDRNNHMMSNRSEQEILHGSQITYDNHGNLLEFSRNISDSTTLPSITPAQARKKVIEFITRFGTLQNLSDSSASNDTTKVLRYSFISGSNEQYDFKIERKIELPHRTDYQYTWSGKSAYIDDPIEMNITISGNKVSDFKIKYIIPEKYTLDDTDVYKTTTVTFFYVLMFLLIAYLAYKKIKSGEIGFKTAILLSLITGVAFSFHLYSMLIDESGVSLLLPLVLGTLFYSGAVFIVWAVSEAVTRDVWKEKFIPIDLISKGYIFHSRIGESILNGLSGGFGITVVWLILLLLAQSVKNIWSVSIDTSVLSFFNSPSPATSILVEAIYSSILLVAVFFNVIESGLRLRINSVSVILLLSGLIWAAINLNGIHPIYYGISIEVIIGVLLMLIYFKTDVLTTLITLITFKALNIGLSLFTSGNTSLINSGYLFILLLIIITVVAVISIFTKDKIKDYNSIVPAFAKNITERQRLQRELEIARDVQMSFLPRTNPILEGLKVASKCIPALEVGGDYYDFVYPDKNKLGVIIGDVSGKGTQAAFYMTLTKGFLRALSKSSDSPAKILKEMNSLFYENVDRGTFISMIFGLFDVEQKLFKIARAGHNPVIVKNSKSGNAELLHPTGLALGLEKGIIFNRTIQEETISFDSGDIFVFYTDGFPEAMDKKKVEFGEKALTELVEKYHHLEVEEMADQMIAEVKKFIGNADQHDDMTIVIVKIT